MNHSQYHVEEITDLFILIRDVDAPGRRFVTNDADRVVSELHARVTDLTHRRVFYQDSEGVVDAIRHQKGVFTGFSHCTEGQRRMLMKCLL